MRKYTLELSKLEDILKGSELLIEELRNSSLLYSDYVKRLNIGDFLGDFPRQLEGKLEKLKRKIYSDEELSLEEIYLLTRKLTKIYKKLVKVYLYLSLK